VRSPPPWLVLTIGLVAVSTAAPLIKLAAVPALAIAAWRTAATGALYGGVSGGGTAGGPLTGREWVRLLSGGALMAAHFGLWIAAFEWTSYASAVLLLVLQPVFAAVLGRVFLGERLTGRMLAGISASLVGLLLLVHEDLDQPRHLFGDGLAIAGTLAIACYYVVVAPVRHRIPFRTYMTRCYGFAGALLAVTCLLTATPLVEGYTEQAWTYLALLVLVPTVVGHACFNWCIKRVRLFTLNMLIVLEPAIALALGAWWLEDAAPITASQVAGGVVLGAAVIVGLRRKPE